MVQRGNRSAQRAPLSREVRLRPFGARHRPGPGFADVPQLRTGCRSAGSSRRRSRPRREIVSKPPHWIPHEPTAAEFRRDLQCRATRRSPTRTAARAIRRRGGFIPSTASNLLPSMRNSLIVACAVAILNLLIGDSGGLCDGQDPLPRPASLDLRHPHHTGDPRHRAGRAVLPVHPQSRPARYALVARSSPISRSPCRSRSSS